jgi:DNA-binding GntR family transcriptional regulator
MDHAMDDDEHDRWADLNTEFHRAIGRITGMPMLQEMTELVLAHWDRIRRHFFKRVFLKRIQRAQHEHHEILHAMQDQNDVLLESLVKIHTQGALAAYMEHLDQRPSEEPPAHPDGSINIRPMPNDQRAQGVSVTNDRAFH